MYPSKCRHRSSWSELRGLRQGIFFTSIPRVEISFHGSDSARTLPLIPHYLFYIMASWLRMVRKQLYAKR